MESIVLMYPIQLTGEGRRVFKKLSEMAKGCRFKTAVLSGQGFAHVFHHRKFLGPRNDPTAWTRVFGDPGLDNGEKGGMFCISSKINGGGKRSKKPIGSSAARVLLSKSSNKR